MEISTIVWCLILCAFFSGMEIAFVSSNKIYLEIEKKQDNFISKILSKLTEKPSKFIATMLIGNTYCIGSLWVFYGRFSDDLDRKSGVSFFWFFQFFTSNDCFDHNCFGYSRIFIQSFLPDLCQYSNQGFCTSCLRILPFVLFYFNVYSSGFLILF